MACAVQTQQKRHFATFRAGSLGKHSEGKRTRHLILGQFVKSRRIFLEFNSYPSLKREREFCVFTPSTQRRRSKFLDVAARQVRLQAILPIGKWLLPTGNNVLCVTQGNFQGYAKKTKIINTMVVSKGSSMVLWANKNPMQLSNAPQKWKPIKTLHLTQQSFQNKNTSALSRLGEHGPLNFVFIHSVSHMFA